MFHIKSPFWWNSISFFSEILLEPSEVALSDLFKSRGTTIHLLHVVVLQCLEKILVERENKREIERERKKKGMIFRGGLES